MIIELNDILSCENKELSKEVSLDMVSFDSKLGSFPITKQVPFKLHVLNVGNQNLQIECDVKLVVSIPCDRCMEDVPTEFDIQIREELKLDGAGKIVSDDLDAIDYMIGSNLDVDKLIYGEILVNWPSKVLCKDDCRGICRKCGINLNFESCDCDQTELDPRMAAIQDIFKKSKEV